MFSGPKQIEKLKRGDIVFLSEIITHSMYWQEYQPVDHPLNYNMDQIMIEKQKSYKSDFTKTEKDDVDFWELRVEEREHIMNQIAKNARTNRIRTWIELTFMLGFIYYMLYDMYKDGDLDTIIKFLT